ncbi:MAG TPA: class I SAM-dependent methyltransferase [Acidimicrobiia bacterium]|nr:class I SAM-dependent methyltransferase [Acidimicrobiia bacterium]
MIARYLMCKHVHPVVRRVIRRLIRLIRRFIPWVRERNRLLRCLPKAGAVVEVGVWEGDFSQLLLDKLRPRTLHLVDPWQFVPEQESAWYGGARAKSQEDMDRIYERVLARFDREIAARRVIISRQPSVAAAATMAWRKFEVVYIDGDHTYDAVRADLHAWAPLIAQDGVLAGDDYGDYGWWDKGVKRAVDEFASHGWTLSLIGSQFVLQRESGSA